MLMPDAKRPRVSPSPTSYENGYTPGWQLRLDQWFAEIRAVDNDVSQYAFGILKQHFASAGLELKGNQELPTTWTQFCWQLADALYPVLRDSQYDAMVRDLLADLVDFSLLNPAGDPASRLADMLERLFGYYSRSSVEPLLPVKAQAEIDAAQQILDARYAEELRRMDQMSY